MLLLLEEQIVDLISDLTRPSTKEAMGVDGLGLACAKNQVGSGVVRRHGGRSWL